MNWKLYYFNPNDYGQEWFVMAESLEQAEHAVNKHIEDTSCPEDIDLWKKVKSYTIDVYEANQVIQSEIA